MTQAQPGPGFLRTRSLVYSPSFSGAFCPQMVWEAGRDSREDCAVAEVQVVGET